MHILQKPSRVEPQWPQSDGQLSQAALGKLPHAHLLALTLHPGSLVSLSKQTVCIQALLLDAVFGKNIGKMRTTVL